MEKQIETTIDLGCRVERLGGSGFEGLRFRASGFRFWSLGFIGLWLFVL